MIKVIMKLPTVNGNNICNICGKALPFNKVGGSSEIKNKCD